MIKKKYLLNIASVIYILALLVYLQSCNYAKYVPTNKSILWQNKIKITSKLNKENTLELNNQLEAAVLQQPNTVILGLNISTLDIGNILPRNKLIMYNLFIHKKIEKDLHEKDSISYMIKQRLAQKPVVFDSISVTTTINNMKSVMFNQGYFYSKIKDSILIKKNKKTFVTYTIVPGKNYILNNIIYKIKNKKIEDIVLKNKNESLIKNGEVINFKSISNERDRLSKIIIENGFYNFRQTAINIIVDTVDKKYLNFIDNPFDQIFDKIKSDTGATNAHSTADVIIYIEDSINNNAIKQSKINNVIVYLDKKTDPNLIINKYKETVYNTIIYRYYNMPINFKAISENIFINSNSKYNSQDISTTVSRLNNLNVFKTVKIDVKQKDDSTLDCIIKLEMANKYSDIIEFDASSGTLYSLGSGLKYTFSNNNIMKGASQLNMSIQGGLQALSDKTQSYFKGLEISQYNYGINSNLVFPRILLPFSLIKKINTIAPTTNIGLGYSRINRTNTYTLESENANITYAWRQNKKINWRVSPVFFTRVNTFILSDSLKAQTLTDESLRRNLDKYFILGSNATIEYTNKVNNFQWHYSYCRLSIEAAGGILSSIKKVFTDSIDPQIRNYAKLETEYRHYINSRKSSWVNRVFASVGIPYNNQTNLPLIKQISAGGSYSLRGWSIRQIGPGASLDTNNSNLLNLGDIKLEANSEFRFGLLKLFSGNINLEGATFTDVGNIWEYKNKINPEREFNFNKIYPTLAADVGVGARLDFSLFLIRLDWAMQVKKPYIAENNGWTINNIDIGSHLWRKENIKFQFGINYPF